MSIFQLFHRMTIAGCDDCRYFAADIGECVGHFIECIINNAASPLSFASSRGIAEIGWAAQMSAAMGKEIPLPLDIEEAKRFFEAE